MSRVLVDASAAFDQRAGVGRYSRGIINQLLQTETGIDWTLLHAPDRRGASEAGWRPPDGSMTVTYPLSRRRVDQLGSRLGLPIPTRIFTGPQDLVYSPDFIAPPMRGAPRIITIHDLAFLTHPHLTTPGTAAFLRRAVEREVKQGAHLAVVSRTTGQRVQDHFALPAKRLRVIRNGVDRRFFDATPLEPEVRYRVGLADAYVLMVGTIEPRKNYETVLRAIQSRADEALPLVIVGRIGWGTSHLVPQIHALQQAGRVIWLSDLADALLPGVYAGASGVLYPSWTEGFGLPVIEALAAGRPVVTGDDPVFAEVGGQYATMVDPGDADALVEAIRGLETVGSATDDTGARRAWAARYNWERPARELRRWIDDLTGGPGG